MGVALVRALSASRPAGLRRGCHPLGSRHVQRPAMAPRPVQLVRQEGRNNPVGGAAMTWGSCLFRCSRKTRLPSFDFLFTPPMSLSERTRPGLGIIEACLPSPAKKPPSGPGWLHEIKHDGFRILARRDSAGVRLITRAGNEFSHRFPFIGMAVGKLPARSCLIDGEAIVCDQNGLAVFELIRRHGALASAVLCAFDLLELDGRDLRREPIEKRKALLAKLLKEPQTSIVLNEVYEEDGAIVFREACKLGCEGIVSKRLGSMYRRGRSPHWVKVKNPKAPAVKREAEEDWRR
jgi:bifunctional non-homologous end joining protein LigD